MDDDGQRRRGPLSATGDLHVSTGNEQPADAFAECPDWFAQEHNADLMNDFVYQDPHPPPSEPPLMDQLWPELAAGNPPDASHWQIPAPYPQPQLPPQSAILPSTKVPEPGVEGKKGRHRIPFTSRKILEDSFERHREHPYVPQDELRELVIITGLTIKQIRTFFANARARKLPPVVEPHKPEVGSTHASVGPSDPLERYLSSSSDQEGADENAVHEAAKKLRRPLRERRRRMSNAALSASGSNAGSSSSSAGSIDSNHSQTYDSAYNRGSRRGRKRRQDPTKKQITSVARKPSSPSRRFQCTFCVLDFAQKYDWRRHEESVHFPQKEWVCMPDGPVDDNSHCVFCNQHNPDKRHLDSHKSITCSDAPHAQRAFLRKDKLIQHIKQVHVCQPPKMMKEWCRPIDRNISLLCGLCVSMLPDWGSRADHIVSHFNDGITMEMWILERPGGILTPDILPVGDILRGMASYYTPITYPKGTHICETCALPFRHMSNLILHRRQVHNIFRATDLARKYWPSSTSFGPDAGGGQASPAAANTNLGQIQEEQADDDSVVPMDSSSQVLSRTSYHPVVVGHPGGRSSTANPVVTNTNTSSSSANIAEYPTAPDFPFTQSLTHTHTNVNAPHQVPFSSITSLRNPALDFAPLSTDTYPAGAHTAYATPPSSLLDPLADMSSEERERARKLHESGYLGGGTHGMLLNMGQYGDGGEEEGNAGSHPWPSPYDGSRV